MEPQSLLEQVEALEHPTLEEDDVEETLTEPLQKKVAASLASPPHLAIPSTQELL